MIEHVTKTLRSVCGSAILMLAVLFCVAMSPEAVRAQSGVTPNSPFDISQIMPTQSSSDLMTSDFSTMVATPGPVGVETGMSGLNPDQMVSPGGLTSTLKLLLLLTVLSLAPSILLMTTCFLRIVIVMGLLRQAMGTQQLPPNQVLISLSLFLTMMVMWPTWQQSYEEGVKPYSESSYATKADQQRGLSEAITRTLGPMRAFMSEQISRTGNDSAIWLFWEYEQQRNSENGMSTRPAPSHYDEVPLTILLPAYMMSELKTAFVIGFQLYLPFVVIDMVISSILISMGMMMLPPVLISLPFKILLFVLVDGWTLTISMLLKSFA